MFLLRCSRAIGNRWHGSSSSVLASSRHVNFFTSLPEGRFHHFQATELQHRVSQWPASQTQYVFLIFFFFSTFCIIYTNLFTFVDSLTHFLGNSDIDIVSRARDMATNSVMREIAQEDPQGQSAYQDAVRHHIVATFQRLRLSLLVLDGLMEAYNSSK